jgi:sarcosine oxidase gamma subunit
MILTVNGRMVELASIIAVPMGSIASLAARKHCGGALRDTINHTFGIDLSDAPCRRVSADLTFLWTGPDKWLVLSAIIQPDFEETLRKVVDAVACVTDQSDGRYIL